MTTTQAHAINLARKCEWYPIEADPADNYTVYFRKHETVGQGADRHSVINARFSPTGRLTKLEGLVFMGNSLQLRSVPARDKGTRLSHWLTEGIN